LKALKYFSIDVGMPIPDLIQKAFRDLLKKYEKTDKK
jgi:hypothetical protein